MNSAISLPPNPCYSRNFLPKYRSLRSSLPTIFSVLGTSHFEKVREIAEVDMLRTLIKEREFSGYFIAKISDRIWLKGAISSHNNTVMAELVENNVQSPKEASIEETEIGGFLKLKRSNEWVWGIPARHPPTRR